MDMLWRETGGDMDAVFCVFDEIAFGAMKRLRELGETLKRGTQATGDRDFLLCGGAEMVLETALLWLDAGTFREKGFCINGVTGPDEYTALVNNNCYTNLMAKANLEFALELLDFAQREEWRELREIVRTVGICETDQQMQHAAASMMLPYDAEKQLFAG